MRRLCLRLIVCRKHYIDVQRREEAFDLSGVQHMMGAFTSAKGVS